MAQGIKRTVAAILLAAAALAPVLTAPVPATAAPAAPAAPMFCTSSIDPKCQPGNLPILIESGVVSITGSGTAAATATATGAVGVITTSSAGTAAGLGAATMTTVSGSVMGAAYLAGIGSLVIATTEAFFPDGGGTATSCGDGVNSAKCITFLGYGTKTVSGTTTEGVCFQLTDALTTGSFPMSVNPTGSTSTYSVSSARSAMSGGVVSCPSGANGFIGTWPTAPVHGGTWYFRAPDASVRILATLPSASDQVTGDVRVTIECSTAPDAHTTQTVTENVTVLAGDPLPVPDISCETGVLSGVEIEWLPDGASDWLSVVNPLGVPDTLLEMVELYPECFGPQGSLCTVTLWHIEGSSKTSCGPAARYCPDWAQNASEYECRYGSHVVEITICSMFRDPKKGLAPNFEPDPENPGEWKPIPVTAPVETPQTFTDPAGEPAPWPTADEEADPGTEDCWPTGWGIFNPLAWVYQPVKCAFEWAFIPRTAVLESTMTGITDAWATSAPAVLADFFVNAEFPAWPSGCEGITVDLTWLRRDAFADADFGESFTLLNACPGDVLEPWAMGSSLFIGVGCVFLVFRTWPRLLGQLVNYGGIDGS